MLPSSKNARQVAFYRLFIGCKIQANARFFDYATKFYSDLNTAFFEQAHPDIHMVRSTQCSKCPASTGYNEGLGIDCWFMMNLPLDEKFYYFVYNSLYKNIRLRMRDLSINIDYDEAIGEILRTENAVIGGLHNGWLVDSDILRKRIELNTSRNTYNVSVASVLGYILRDGSTITHMDFLAEVFNLNWLGKAKVDPESPVNTYAIMFDTAKRIKTPIKSKVYSVENVN